MKSQPATSKLSDLGMRAEIHAGELLADMEKAKGSRDAGRPSIGGSTKRPPKDNTPTLSDLGVTKTQSWVDGWVQGCNIRNTHKRVAK
jgi:hypothetical protein